LKISDFQLPELRQQLKTGLNLQTGQFSISIKSPLERVANGVSLIYADYQVSDSEFSDFHVSITRGKGLRGWIRPQVLFNCDGYSPFKPLPIDQAFPLLEWGLNWCVSSHANSYLIIHAAVVERNGFAAVLPAPPGSGKSTLCAALVHHGWRLLSDELTLIRLDSSLVEPLPRPVSLKNRSIEVIKNFVPSAVFSPSVHDTVKGTVAHMKPSTTSVVRSSELAKIGWIIFPKYQAESPTLIKPISKGSAFMRVADNAFNYGLLGAQAFRVLSSVMDDAEAIDLTYSSLPEAMEMFADLAEKSNDNQ